MKRQRGMSLIELMIAIAMALVISLALSVTFSASTKTRQEIQRNGEQIENGRVAMDTLLTDIRAAGYWDGLEYTGFANPVMPSFTAAVPSNLAAPSVCENAALDVLKASVPIYLQGLDDESGTVPTCFEDTPVANWDWKTGTDVLVIRRAATCEQGVANCDAAAPYFQASKCSPPYANLAGTVIGTVAANQELSNGDVNNWFGVEATTGALTLHTRTCGPTAGNPLAPVRRYLARIYFVANNDQFTGSIGDGIPTLKVAEIRGTAWQVSTVASGIEQMQIEYGVDTSPDAAPDTAPESYVVASAVADWRRVTAVKVHLLARNSTATPQYLNTRTYVLGKKANGTDDKTFPINPGTPFNDAYRRHAFSGQAVVINPVGLRGG